MNNNSTLSLTSKSSNNIISKARLSEEEKERITTFVEYMMDSERSKNTIASYLYALKMYFNDYEEISKQNMILFKEKQMELHKPRTAALRCIALNKYCDFIGKPECKVKRVKVFGNNSIGNIPTLEEYQHLISCLKQEGHEKQYWMMRFLASTGARASELLSLEKSCLTTGEFTLHTKGKVRTILIPDALINESQEYFKTVDSKYLFPNRQGYKMQIQGLSKMIRLYGNRYGLRPETLHPHAFRHLFALLFLDSNGNITLLSNLLGHESVRTTAIYLQMSSERQKEELNKAVTW